MLTSSKQEVFFSNLIKKDTCNYINWIYKEIKQINKEVKMSKGEMLIRLVSGETCINPALLMEDKKFVAQAKKLIKNKLEFMVVKDKLVKWCNNNY